MSLMPFKLGSSPKAIMKTRFGPRQIMLASVPWGEQGVRRILIEDTLRLADRMNFQALIIPVFLVDPDASGILPGAGR
jgi:hypothetical protein